MDKEDKYKWLKQYAKPCFSEERDSLEKLPHIKTIEDFLQGDYSREKVRDYFFIPHNLRTIKNKNYIHLIIPYAINSIGENIVSCELNEPFYEELPIPFCNKSFDNWKIKEAREEGILRDLKKGDILLVHFQEIVDYCNLEDLKKYEYLWQYENSSVW